ncbi:MAG: hypothetical protein BWY71_01293 [Planctomycetes bacterium ADurb.Bin412]|nr:MAG: hypothetical protein BWY71_01293 [Planctomycetes bacterium ADurb.Bin412]
MFQGLVIDHDIGFHHRFTVAQDTGGFAFQPHLKLVPGFGWGDILRDRDAERTTAGDGYRRLGFVGRQGGFTGIGSLLAGRMNFIGGFRHILFHWAGIHIRNDFEQIGQYLFLAQINMYLVK